MELFMAFASSPPNSNLTPCPVHKSAAASSLGPCTCPDPRLLLELPAGRLSQVLNFLPPQTVADVSFVNKALNSTISQESKPTLRKAHKDNFPYPLTPGTFLASADGRPVNSVAFSPNVKSFASGSNKDCTIKLSDISTGACLRTFIGHKHIVYCVCFSQDGQFLASGSFDHTVNLWNVATGDWLRTFVGHEDIVDYVCFSPDGQFLASSSLDGTLKLWNVATGALLHTFVHNTSIDWISFSPDGQFLAAACFWKGTKLWNVASRICLYTFLEPYNALVYCVTFSPNGQFLASGTDHMTIILRNTATGSYLKEMRCSGPVKSISFSHDGRFIMAGVNDNTVEMWNVATGNCLKTFQHDDAGSLHSLALSPDSHFFVTAYNNIVRIWDIELEGTPTAPIPPRSRVPFCAIS
jgi:WD40 repeat protein